MASRGAQTLAWGCSGSSEKSAPHHSGSTERRPWTAPFVERRRDYRDDNERTTHVRLGHQVRSGPATPAANGGSHRRVGGRTPRQPPKGSVSWLLSWALLDSCTRTTSAR